MGKAELITAELYRFIVSLYDSFSQLDGRVIGGEIDDCLVELRSTGSFFYAPAVFLYPQCQPGRTRAGRWLRSLRNVSS